MDEKSVPLEALSAAQRDLVERHLPLVRHTLKRHRHLIRRGQNSRDFSELFQEGCLALIEAVRNHDRAKHGHFAAFAMARIHFALSRYVHERQHAVRVPFITQRRHKSARKSEKDEAEQARLPMVVRIQDFAPFASRRTKKAPPGLPETSIGDLMRERIDVAMRRVVETMKQGRRCSPGTREVVERCARERWSVPEPDSRTSIRQLAKSLNCSVGRITHCEERFKKRMAETLAADEDYVALRERAGRSRHGLDERIGRKEIEALRPARAADELSRGDRKVRERDSGKARP